MAAEADTTSGTGDDGRASTGAGRLVRHDPSSANRFMPPDHAIALDLGRGATRQVPDRGPRKHPMRGFEEQYVDIVDYIVRITHRIWEDQDVGYIYDTYAPGCRVHDDAGLQIGVERMVSGTIDSIEAFADVRHYADDVIWAGDDERGFVTSHRAFNVGHHTGTWRWGPATHRPLKLWVIANCLVVENLIVEEWVLYNTVARLLQVGIDPLAAARLAGNAGGVPALSGPLAAEVDRLIGGRVPTVAPEVDLRASEDVEGFVRALLHNLYNRRDLSVVDRAYAPNVDWHGTSNREGHGREDVRAMARKLLATFPDFGLEVDEVYWMGNAQDGWSVSVRWTGAGTHDGHVLYGAPTGRKVRIWGMSQLYVRQGLIVEDWSLFNEFDVMTHLFRDETPALVPSPAPAA
jgi:predicted ester cyclase